MHHPIIAYLETLDNQTDIHLFTKDDDGPDLVKAREFAESMREKLGDLVGDRVVIEQRNHQVTVGLIKTKELV